MKTSYPTITIDKRPFLIKEELNSCGNLKEKGILNQLYTYLNDSNAFLLFVRSENEKTFGFFIPSKFESTGYDLKKTDNQLAFYWIDDEKLVTCQSTFNPIYKSNDHRLITLRGMEIMNRRWNSDYAKLYSE